MLRFPLFLPAFEVASVVLFLPPLVRGCMCRFVTLQWLHITAPPLFSISSTTTRFLVKNKLNGTLPTLKSTSPLNMGLTVELASSLAEGASEDLITSILSLIEHTLQGSLDKENSKAFLFLNEVIITIKDFTAEARKAAYDMLIGINFALQKLPFATSDGPYQKLVSMAECKKKKTKSHSPRVLQSSLFWRRPVV